MFDCIVNLDIFPFLFHCVYVLLSVPMNLMKIIVWFNIKHMMMLSIKAITTVLKVSAYIITPIRLTAILAIMSVSTFRTDDTLYVLF